MKTDLITREELGKWLYLMAEKLRTEGEFRTASVIHEISDKLVYDTKTHEEELNTFKLEILDEVCKEELLKRAK